MCSFGEGWKGRRGSLGKAQLVCFGECSLVDLQVYAAASDDMDTLCFDTPILLKKLMLSEQKKEPVQEIDLQKALEGLSFDRDQFIDLCILLGCDYCDTIPKVGPTTALKLIREHKSIEKVIKHLGSKYTVPENFPYQDARELFLKPDVIDPEECDLKWDAPDVEGLVKFLVQEKGFAEDRVRSGVAKLNKNLKSTTQCMFPCLLDTMEVVSFTNYCDSSDERLLQANPKNRGGASKPEKEK